MNESEKRIAILVGTRPEAIKLIPVYKALLSLPDLRIDLVSTGQHKELINPVFGFFKIFPGFDLQVGKANQTLSELTASLISAIDNYIRTNEPHCIVVQGDTTSSMAGSLVGFYNRLKVAHVEAGLRTYRKDSPFPEEINRRMTSVIADFHFAPTIEAQNNLKREGASGVIEVVGNTVVDSLLMADEVIGKNITSYQDKFKTILSGHNRIILITGHRRENFGDKFREIFTTIIKLAREYPETAFVYPVHFNPNVRDMAHQMLRDIDNIFLIEPLPYDEMLFLIKNSYFVMTDSGGLQEECPSFGKPVIILRETTERPEGVRAGCCILGGVKESTILEAFYKLMKDESIHKKMSSVKNPFGDGHASLRIANTISRNI